MLGVICKKEMEKYVLVVRMQSRLITFECILCIECCLNKYLLFLIVCLPPFIVILILI